MAVRKKKIITVLGSPRKDGASAALARKIAEGAKDNGAVIEEIFLQDMKISPCKGCGACQKNNSRKCVIKDDMQKLYPLLQKADGFILATPVYWCSISAQLKAFIDRSYALVEMKTFTTIFTNKKLVLAISYGDPDVLTSGAMNIIRTFQDILNFSRGECIGVVHCAGKTDKKILEAAYETGRKF